MGAGGTDDTKHEGPAPGRAGDKSRGLDRGVDEEEIPELIRFLLEYELPPAKRRGTHCNTDPNVNPFTGERVQPNEPGTGSG